MDELDIVLATQLEADEDASARRIAAQLPRIAQMIDRIGRIRVGVEIDEAGLNNQARRFAQQVNRAVRNIPIDMVVNIDQGAINDLRNRLRNLNVSDAIADDVIRGIDNMGLRIQNVQQVYRSAADEAENLANLQIQGLDSMGNMVRLTQTFNVETGEVLNTVTAITTDYAEMQRQMERNQRIAERDNQNRLSFLTQQRTELERLQAVYTGRTSAKGLHDEEHLNDVGFFYQYISERIADYENQAGALSRTQQANLRAEIDFLQQLIKEYQQAEYVATTLRTKDTDTIRTEGLGELNTYMEKLRSMGILTQEFEQRIIALRAELSRADGQAGITAYLNGFDTLKSDVDAFKERIASANKLFAEMGREFTKIAAIQQKMIGLSPESEEYAALKDELDFHQSVYDMLERQSLRYNDIFDYSKGLTTFGQVCQDALLGVATTQAEVNDEANKANIEYSRMADSIARMQKQSSMLSFEPTSMGALKEAMAAYTEARTNYVAAQEAGEPLDEQSERLVITYNKVSEALNQVNRELAAFNGLNNMEFRDFKLTEDIKKARADLEALGRAWSALKQDKSLRTRFDTLSNELKAIEASGDPAALRRWNAELKTFKSEIKAAGKNMQSAFDTFKANAGKVAQWLSATSVIFKTMEYARRGITAVIALDTAMIDLRKTTDETAEAYERFYFSSNKTAKQLGVTTESIIAQTAEWSRLGYTMKEAAKLAENSAIFAAVSPEMDSATATDGLISIIKAFGIQTEDTLDGVISKVNEVGNRFAVSNADIVDALTRSSSAMAVANNSFEQTVALATAAIEITRDAAGVGNALKSLSMRIRGYDEETEEYSEDVAQLTGKIADLTKTASTPGGISLFEENNPEEYRSTYDILKDISEIQDEITDKDEAKLLEALFGKRQAQVGAAILSNFEQAEKSIDTMANSAGSAMSEMENIYDSLDYKINALGETWVGVAQNLFGTDEMKTVVDVLIELSEVVKGLTDTFGLFGTIGLGTLGLGIVKTAKTVGEPKMTGFSIAPTYAPVVTRNELYSVIVLHSKGALVKPTKLA